MKITALYTWLIVSVTSAYTVLPASAAPLSCRYEASNRTLTVTLNEIDRFKYVFNKGGAINGIFDLAVAPTVNLIGPSYQGETTDRVVQWTYWNSRYKAPSNPTGSRDRRANATMEGSFAEAATCEVVATPSSGSSRSLRFVSRLRHWFYANLNTHGAPDFLTDSEYEVLDDGSLKLTRRVARQPWKLKNIYEDTAGGTTTLHTETIMVCENYGRGSVTSYFEAWSPFRRSALPSQKHGLGNFTGTGYQFWKPQDLGGWAMAYGTTQAVAVVFGKTQYGDPANKVEVAFNRLDLPGANLSILLPAVEASWPDHQMLTQVLIFVVGAPADVETRATALADTVPVPTISEIRNLEMWRQAHFGTLFTSSAAATTADFDNDGMSNLLEYALDTLPTSAISATQPDVRITNNGTQLSLSFLRARTDLTYVIEASSTLAPGSWTVLATNPGTVGQSVTFTDPVFINPRRFLKLSVSAP